MTSIMLQVKKLAPKDPNAGGFSSAFYMIRVIPSARVVRTWRSKATFQKLKSQKYRQILDPK